MMNIEEICAIHASSNFMADIDASGQFRAINLHSQEHEAIWSNMKLPIFFRWHSFWMIILCATVSCSDASGKIVEAPLFFLGYYSREENENENW